MMFSKSFGYAVRGVLYIATIQAERPYVHLEEIAAQLVVPRHFMGKILKRLVKEKVLLSSKGPLGGFTIQKDTLQLPLVRLIQITDSLDLFHTCVLRLNACSALNPCPMHYQMANVNASLENILTKTTVGDLLKGDNPDFVKSLSTNAGTESRIKQ